MSTPTAEAIQNAADVLTKCAAYDPWFPHPTEAMILAWAEQLALTNLSRADQLAGITDCYRTHGSGFKPLPADIIGAARRLRQDRYDRTPIHDRGAYEAISDTKATDTIASIGASIGTTTAPTARLAAAKEGLQTCHGRTESQAAIREYFAAQREARHTTTRGGPEPVLVGEFIDGLSAVGRRAISDARDRLDNQPQDAVADRHCACDRPIFDDQATSCDRCAPVIDGPQPQPNGDSETA
jgi:hypothetical protein